MKIKSVIVVGGGSSGWMSASALSKGLGKNLKVTVIESGKSSPVGVGESTIIPFNRFLQYIGLEDHQWMKHCNATYKTSIRFTDFVDKGSGSFEYPFGGRDTGRDDNRTAAWSQLAVKYDLGNESLAEFTSDMYYLAKYNRLTKNDLGQLKFDFDEDTAYHFDAGLFGEYLKNNVCIPAGVNHIIDDIVGSNKNEDGYITSLIGESGSEYEADLIVDCTGFKSLILEGEMNSEFVSFKDWLSNDSALATRIPYTDKPSQLENVTNCTAIENGWVWNIPLWNRVGTGYVYSSDFVDDETAEKEFKQHLGLEEVDVRKINIKHGYHKQGWVKNVVGVGLSYAFVEPLESTGLVSTHLMIEYLCELLDRRENVTAFDIDGYNYNCATTMQGFKEFVALHYKFASRSDTPYWKYQTEIKDWWRLQDCRDKYDVPVPGSTGSFQDIYAMIHNMHSVDHVWTTRFPGIMQIMCGMGHRPIGNHLFNKVRKGNPMVDGQLETVYNDWRKYADRTIESVKEMQSTFEFLQENIYSN